MRRKKLLPPRPTMCETCPFRPGGWAEVRGLLEERALKEGTPICHNTGNGIGKPRGPSQACRGARDLQLQLFAALGFLEEPTDEAWEAKAAELGLG